MKVTCKTCVHCRKAKPTLFQAKSHYCDKRHVKIGLTRKACPLYDPK